MSERAMGEPERVRETSERQRLLAVDDSLPYLELLANRFEREGFEVLLAQSGLQAFEILKTHTVDCILLDLKMPGLTGREVCLRIRSSQRWRDIPVVMLTAAEDYSSAVEGIEGGADDYVAKSSNFEVLRARVRAQLRRRHFERENLRIREELLRKEAEAVEARAALELANTRAALLTELERKNADLVSARDQLSKSYELIRSQRDELLLAQSRREELISLVVHDLKNPLSTILGNARYLIRQPRLSPDVGEPLADLLAASESMHRMVMNLVDIARSEDGALVLRPADFGLAELIGEVSGEMTRRAAERQQKIELVGPVGPSSIQADRDLIRRLLENLLDNALRYTPSGGTVSISARCAGEGLVEMRVRDEGPGIPAEFREKIFEKHFQLQDAGAVRAPRGRGLGLAFCRLAAESHGGRIWVESEGNGGSDFCVRLPLRPAFPQSD